MLYFLGVLTFLTLAEAATGYWYYRKIRKRVEDVETEQRAVATAVTIHLAQEYFRPKDKTAPYIRYPDGDGPN